MRQLLHGATVIAAAAAAFVTTFRVILDNAKGAQTGYENTIRALETVGTAVKRRAAQGGPSKHKLVAILVTAARRQVLVIDVAVRAALARPGD